MLKKEREIKNTRVPGALRPSSMFFYRFFSLIFKNRNLLRQFFSILNSIDLHWGTTKNVDPIGSAVLTFIGYKQRNKHSYRFNVIIDR